MNISGRETIIIHYKTTFYIVLLYTCCLVGLPVILLARWQHEFIRCLFNRTNMISCQLFCFIALVYALFVINRRCYVVMFNRKSGFVCWHGKFCIDYMIMPLIMFFAIYNVTSTLESLMLFSMFSNLAAFRRDRESLVLSLDQWIIFFAIYLSLLIWRTQHIYDLATGRIFVSWSYRELCWKLLKFFNSSF